MKQPNHNLSVAFELSQGVEDTFSDMLINTIAILYAQPALIVKVEAKGNGAALIEELRIRGFGRRVVAV